MKRIAALLLLLALAPGLAASGDPAVVAALRAGAASAAVRAGAEVRAGADDPARRALAGCISDASPPVDHCGAFDWVRTRVGGSSMGSSN